MALNTGLPNPPYKDPIVDDDGRVTGRWVEWFRQAFVRMGGNLSLTNSQLTQTSLVKADENSVAIAALQTAFNTGLGKGPVL